MPAKKKPTAKNAVSKAKSTKEKGRSKDKTKAFLRIGTLIEKGLVKSFEDFELNSVSKTALGKATGIQNVSLNNKLDNPLKFTFHDAKILSGLLGISHERVCEFICKLTKDSSQK